jgi:predicted nucleotidyltransferase
MQSSYFSPDILEFIRLLSIHKVRYVIVGGEAVIYYGYARLTGDVDFFYEISPENARRLYNALDSFWGGAIPGIKTPDELLSEGTILQFGVPPNRIDLINSIDAVPFDEAWKTRTVEKLRIKEKKYLVNFIGLEHLIKNKKAAKRFKDLDDLQYLTKLIKKE